MAATDLSAWDLSETRSTGHNEIVAEGLHIWTEGATSEDKAAGYRTVDFPLYDLGDETIAESIDYAATLGITPGLQLVVDFDNDGSSDGILVGEAVYGNTWWLTSSAAQTVKDNAPHNGSGYGSSYYGEINEWLTKFPDARVKAIGYSLGSGVHGDGVIKRITLGCANYTFELPSSTPTPVPPPTKPALSGEVIYDAIPAILPSSVPSQPFQAQATSEFGDKITFATGTSRNLVNAAVTLTSWACESGEWNLGTCVTTPGATFSHPITLNLYNVAGDGSVGSLIASRTQTFDIPYRPSADTTCADQKQWKDTTGACFNGYNHVVVFDLTGITVPDTVIYGIAYDTQTYGASPKGVTGPYDSLNVGLNTDTSAPYIGTDVDTDSVFWDATYLGRPAGLTIDTGLSDYRVATTFTAEAPVADNPPSVTIVAPTPDENSYVRGVITGHATATDDIGMGSYYLRFWKDAFEIAGGGTLVQGCQMAPGADLLGTSQDVSCDYDTRTNPDGTYVFSAQFQDSGIHWGQALRTFIVDNTRPVVSLDNPTSTQSVFNSNDVDFIVSATDNLALDRITGNIYKTGTLFKSNSQAVTGTSSSYTIDIASIPEGEYTLRYNASDKAGNIASTKTFDFVIDNTAPTITVKPESVGNGIDLFKTVSFKLYDKYKIDKVIIWCRKGLVRQSVERCEWSEARYLRRGRGREYDHRVRCGRQYYDS